MTRPNDWKTFLEHAIDKIPDAGDKSAATEALGRREYLDAAQIVVDVLPAADFAMFLHEELVAPGFVPSALHGLILDIDPKIVITTNYDEIYDSLIRNTVAPPSFSICRYYETHLVNELRSNRRLIIKAHGCVTHPQQIVLTRKQYFAARRDHPQFYAALDAIFLTHTLLFVGTGFGGDPDIELLLQNTFISAPSAHTHYALVPDGRHGSVKKAIEETHNVKFLEYEAGKHDQVLEALKDLKDNVESIRSLPA